MTPSEYIAKLPAGRKADIARLDKLIRKTVPNLKPFVDGKILGYGKYHYKYASGREGDSARIGVASRAQYVALYVMAADEDGYVAGRYREKLPKAKIGKCCVTFKKLDDLDQKALVSLISEVKKMGWGGAS